MVDGFNYLRHNLRVFLKNGHARCKSTEKVPVPIEGLLRIFHWVHEFGGAKDSSLIYSHWTEVAPLIFSFDTGNGVARVSETWRGEDRGCKRLAFVIHVDVGCWLVTNYRLTTESRSSIFLLNSCKRVEDDLILLA